MNTRISPYEIYAFRDSWSKGACLYKVCLRLGGEVITHLHHTSVEEAISELRKEWAIKGDLKVTYGRDRS